MVRSNPVDPGVTFVPDRLCPYCGYHYTAVGTVDGKAGSPSPGDASVCLNCTEILVFADSKTLRKPTDAEMAAFAGEEWSELHSARRRLQRMRKQGLQTAQAKRGLGRPI